MRLTFGFCDGYRPRRPGLHGPQCQHAAAPRPTLAMPRGPASGPCRVRPETKALARLPLCRPTGHPIAAAASGGARLETEVWPTAPFGHLRAPRSWMRKRPVARGAGLLTMKSGVRSTRATASPRSLARSLQASRPARSPYPREPGRSPQTGGRENRPSVIARRRRPRDRVAARLKKHSGLTAAQCTATRSLVNAQIAPKCSGRPVPLRRLNG